MGTARDSSLRTKALVNNYNEYSVTLSYAVLLFVAFQCLVSFFRTDTLREESKTEKDKVLHGLREIGNTCKYPVFKKTEGPDVPESLGLVSETVFACV